MLLRLSVHACASNEVWKVWGGKSVPTTLIEFWGCERGFAPHRTQRYGRPRARCCCSLSYSSFSTRTCGCIYALCLLFHFRASLLALSFSLPSPFCCSNNETASATTVLRTINLCKCTQLFGILVAFLKRDKLHSWSVRNSIPEVWHYTPPTKNTHYKISSLALRRSAIIASFPDLPRFPSVCIHNNTRLQKTSRTFFAGLPLPCIMNTSWR